MKLRPCGSLRFKGEDSKRVAQAIKESREDGGGQRTLQESRERRKARLLAKQNQSDTKQ